LKQEIEAITQLASSANLVAQELYSKLSAPQSKSKTQQASAETPVTPQPAKKLPSDAPKISPSIAAIQKNLQAETPNLNKQKPQTITPVDRFLQPTPVTKALQDQQRTGNPGNNQPGHFFTSSFNHNRNLASAKTLSCEIKIPPQEVSRINSIPEVQKSGKLVLGSEGAPSFVGSDPIRSVQVCQNADLQRASYTLSLPDAPDSYKKAEALLAKAATGNPKVRIEDCIIGDQKYEIMNGTLQKVNNEESDKPKGSRPGN
jgi:hypothetical protein